MKDVFRDYNGNYNDYANDDYEDGDDGDDDGDNCGVLIMVMMIMRWSRKRTTTKVIGSLATTTPSRKRIYILPEKFVIV